MHRVLFRERLEFEHEDLPVLTVTLRGAAGEGSFEAQLDSGAANTLFSGELLASIGWEPLPAGSSELKRFSGAAGGEILASPFEVELELPSGDCFALTVYGSHSQLSRNLLGRDLLARGLFGLDIERQAVFLSSFRDVTRREIFLSGTD